MTILINVVHIEEPDIIDFDGSFSFRYISLCKVKSIGNDGIPWGAYFSIYIPFLNFSY